MVDADQDPETSEQEPEASEEQAAEAMGPGQVNLDAAGDDEGAEDEVREGPGLAGAVALDPEHLMGALEALILVSDKPIAAVRLARLTRQDVGVVRARLAELVQAYKGRGIVLDEIAGGFQFRTSPRFAPFVRNLVTQKPTKLSRAQLEVLSIIAYRQPVTRPELEDVRGVDSGSALKVLLERNVIKIIGKKDEAGRPMLYGTTNEFLELFGLKSLKDLPTLREFAELTQESRDIFERRIGEPVPGEGMNLETHYEAPKSVDETDGEEGAGASAEGEDQAADSVAGESAEPATADSEAEAMAAFDAATDDESAAHDVEPDAGDAAPDEEGDAPHDDDEAPAEDEERGPSSPSDVA